MSLTFDDLRIAAVLENYAQTVVLYELGKEFTKHVHNAMRYGYSRNLSHSYALKLTPDDIQFTLAFCHNATYREINDHYIVYYKYNGSYQRAIITEALIQILPDLQKITDNNYIINPELLNFITTSINQISDFEFYYMLSGEPTPAQSAYFNYVPNLNDIYTYTPVYTEITNLFNVDDISDALTDYVIDSATLLNVKGDIESEGYVDNYVRDSSNIIFTYDNVYKFIENSTIDSLNTINNLYNYFIHNSLDKVYQHLDNTAFDIISFDEYSIVLNNNLSHLDLQVDNIILSPASTIYLDDTYKNIIDMVVADLATYDSPILGSNIEKLVYIESIEFYQHLRSSNNYSLFNNGIIDYFGASVGFDFDISHIDSALILETWIGIGSLYGSRIETFVIIPNNIDTLEFSLEFIIESNLLPNNNYFYLLTDSVYQYKLLGQGTYPIEYRFGTMGISHLYLDKTSQQDATSFPSLTDQTSIKDVYFESELIYNFDDKFFGDGSMIDLDRYKLYGIGIDINNSNLEVLSLLTSADSLINAIEMNDVYVYKYPLPIIMQNGRNFRSDNYNLNTQNLLLEMDSSVMPIKSLNTRTVKNALDVSILDSTTLLDLDKSTYASWNEDYLYNNFYIMRDMYSTSYDALFMLEDSSTGQTEIIKINSNNLYFSVYDHYNKLYFNMSNSSQVSAYVKNYETDPLVEQNVEFVQNIDLLNNYPNIIKTITVDSITIDPTTLNGDVSYLRIIGMDTTGNTHDIQYDFTSKEELIIDVSSYDIYDNIELRIGYVSLYKNYTYKDSFPVNVNFNIMEYNLSYSCLANVLFVSLTGTLEETPIIPIPESFNNLLTQQTYTFPIQLSLYDIKENVWESLPETTNIQYLNNFVEGGNVDTTFTFETNEFYFDRFSVNYERYQDQIRTFRVFAEDNVNKYVRCYVNHTIQGDNTDLLTGYNLYNAFDIGYETTDGVLAMEGRMSDMTNGMNNDELLKIYKLYSTFTTAELINIGVQIPIKSDQTFYIYDDYAKYLAYDASTSYTNSINLILDIKSKSQLIELEYEYFPKILYFIDYYDIYPLEGDSEKEYISRLEFKLKSIDINNLKVSEILFDVCEFTDDVEFLIPVDYSNAVDPENQTNVEIIFDKEKILNYVNWLIRYKCSDCGEMQFTLNVKIKPTYYGFNYAVFVLGSYLYDINMQYALPYVFYKQDANAFVVLNTNSRIQKEELNFSDLTGSFPIDATGIVSIPEEFNKVSMPTKSITTLSVFNSSLYNKELNLQLKSNSSPKPIDTTAYKFNLSPFDHSMFAITEDLDATNYVGSFNSGIAVFEAYDGTSLITDEFFLPIPSLDSYKTAVLSLIDKYTVYESLKYKHNVESIDEASDFNIFQVYSNIRLQPTEKNTHSTVLPFNGEVNEVVEFFGDVYISVETSLIQDLFNIYGDDINNLTIKVPCNELGFYKDIKTNLGSHDATALDVNFINLYNDDYYIVVNINRIDFSRFRATYRYFLTVDTTSLADIVGDIDSIENMNISIKLPKIKIETILKHAFLKYQNEITTYFIDNCINGTKLYTEMIEDLKLLQAFEGEDEIIENTTINIRYNYINDGVGTLELVTPDGGDPNELMIHTKLYDFLPMPPNIDFVLPPKGDKGLIAAFLKYKTIVDSSFIDISPFYINYNGLYDSLQKRTFLTTGNSNAGINKFLINSLPADNKVVSLYKGDNEVLLNFDNLRFTECVIKIGETNIPVKNNIYGKYIQYSNSINDPLLVHIAPNDDEIVTIDDVYDYLKENRESVVQLPDSTQTTFYTLITKIPMLFFKLFEGYVKVNSITAYSNIPNLDFSIKMKKSGATFVSDSGVVDLQKVIDKFAMGEDFFDFYIFGKPGQTGSFYISFLINYEVSGEQKTLVKDFKIDIVLPASLDNEYLIVTDSMLDLYDISDSGFKKCAENRMQSNSSNRYDAKLD